MTSSSVNAIVYYNAAIITTKHDSTFVRSSPKIIELDNKMSLDALKKAIGNKISLPNGKVVNDIHFLLPVSFVGDCGQCRACMLNDGEDIMTMFSMFKQISKLTCLELYITTAYTPTQTCAHPPPISARSLNLGGLDEYLDDTLNLESIVIFLTLNSPRLASSSPGLRENFSSKQATRLGELIPSALNKQLAWASFPCTKWLFSINSHAWEEEKIQQPES
ncbi:hypothetical protein GmHk_06G016795 [Glycine max]|nr:hypothetical protein GmHk_06G016795 [Glycine max]